VRCTSASVGLRRNCHAVAAARHCCGRSTACAAFRTSAARAHNRARYNRADVATRVLALERGRLRVDPGTLGNASCRDDLVAAALLVGRWSQLVRAWKMGKTLKPLPAVTERLPRRFYGPVALVVLLIAGTASAGLILHERLPQGAIETQPAPKASDEARAKNALHDKTQASAANDPGESAFRADRDTRKPDMLPYEDPFRPSVAPFKRLSVFDAIDGQFTLSVADARLVPVPSSGPALEPMREDRFTAEMPLDVVPDRAFRIPTPGPGARVLTARALKGEAAVPFVLFRDGAENWFVVSSTKGKIRLHIDFAVLRESFGFEFGKPEARSLPRVPPMPGLVIEAAKEVAAFIGLNASMSPLEIVSRLVAYFRSFTESETPLASQRDIYRDIALSQKGVCRHRAFAFFVTARYFSIPTRVVLNEAHAWVEVHNGLLWKRIDLGGAGTAMDANTSDTLHEPPPDSFEWPTEATRGEEMARRAMNAGTAGGRSVTGGTSSGPSAPQAVAPDEVSLDGGVDLRPKTEITLNLDHMQVARGDRFRVHGKAQAQGEGCENMIVSVVLSDGRSGGKAQILSSVVTGPSGEFEGEATVPTSFPIGKFDLTARTAGNARCGLGASP
jgi:transglutaminase-like putative cysteine protease